MDVLDRLLGHDEWATKQLLELSRGLSDEQLDRDFDIGNRTIRNTFDHVVLNTQFWLSFMRGQPMEYKRESSLLATLESDFAKVFGEFAEFARKIRDEDRYEDTFKDHFDGQMTFSGAIFHVILHNLEHRTEVVHMFSRMGVEELAGVEVDYGLWDWKRRGF